MIGIEEPAALIHAPNESVAPSEIQSMALAEALFSTTLPRRKRPSAPTVSGAEQNRHKSVDRAGGDQNVDRRTDGRCR